MRGGAFVLDPDLVFRVYTGFGSASHFATLINGGWIGADIRIRFRRIARRYVPTDAAEQRNFLFTQWDRMQETVTKMREEMTRWRSPSSTETRGTT